MPADKIASRPTDPADRMAVVDAVIGYATALDTRDWPALASLFTKDARWEYRAAGEVVEGPDAIVARIRPTIERLDATQHVNTNHVVLIDGDEATHTGYYQAQHVRRGVPGGELFLGAGRYEDRLRRTENGWRITHRVLISVWSEGNPAVLRG